MTTGWRHNTMFPINYLEVGHHSPISIINWKYCSLLILALKISPLYPSVFCAITLAKHLSIHTVSLPPSVQGPATSATPPPPYQSLCQCLHLSLYCVCLSNSPFKRYLLVGLCFICQPLPVFYPATLCQQCLWSAVQKRQPDYCALLAFICIFILWSCNSVIRVNVSILTGQLWLFFSCDFLSQISTQLPNLILPCWCRSWDIINSIPWSGSSVW